MPLPQQPIDCSNVEIVFIDTTIVIIANPSALYIYGFCTVIGNNAV